VKDQLASNGAILAQVGAVRRQAPGMTDVTIADIVSQTISDGTIQRPEAPDHGYLACTT
jgi:hypothetical protein